MRGWQADLPAGRRSLPMHRRPPPTTHVPLCAGVEFGSEVRGLDVLPAAVGEGLEPLE